MSSVGAPTLAAAGPRSTPRGWWRESLRLTREHALAFAVMWAVAFVPLIAIAVHVARHGGVLTGVNGGDYFDQFQYLAWIRDEGSHLLASNLWVTGPTPHDYVQPMYLVSGILWRLGLSLQLAYVLWKPVAVLVLFLGFAVYVRHTVQSGRWARVAALALALFYVTPVLPFDDWLHFLSPGHTYQLVLAVNDPDAVLNLWGLEHTAIAIGLMPVFLIACERLLADEPPPGRLWLVTAAVAGLLVSWLHPWQGAILLGVLGGLFLVRGPRRRYLRLAIPAAATLAPLIYGLILSRTDASWHAFEVASTRSPSVPVWALFASFAPIAALAVLGLRRPRGDREWMLLLWILATVAVYVVIPQFPPHALCGISLPLAVLAVAGWRRAVTRLRAPRALAAAAAVAAVLLLTVPSLVDHFNGLPDNFANTSSGAISRSMYRLTDDQADALRFLDRDPQRGAVLAPWLLSLSVPAFTDRPVYVGHLQWEPRGVLLAADTFFASQATVPPGTRRAILAASKARFVLASCDSSSLGSALAPVARPVARFGCVTVYETRAAP
jgi:hypothetical protein